MTRLVKVELRRFFARRLTLIGTAAALIITGLLLFAVWQDSKPLAEAEQRQAQANYEQYSKTFPQDVARCRQEQEAARKNGDNTDFGCDNMTPPRPEDFGKPLTVFKEAAPDYLLGAAFLTAFVAFLIGAGFMGAEFSTGSIGNWLTFEPRRLRVYGSKLLAGGGGPLPLAAGLGGVMLVGSWLIVRHHGTTSGTVWGNLLETGGRGVGLAAVAGMAGVALGGLFRHTAAALGVAMGYMVIVEGIFGNALQKLQPWLINVNFQSWVKHGTTYYVNECKPVDSGGYNCETIEKTLSFSHSATYLGVLVLALLVIGAALFRRRDIT